MTSSRKRTSGSYQYFPEELFPVSVARGSSPAPSPAPAEDASQTGKGSCCNPTVNHREATVASLEKRTFPMTEAEKAGLTKHVQSITKREPEGWKVGALYASRPPGCL